MSKMSKFITVSLTVCTQGTFQKFSVLQCKTCYGLCQWRTKGGGVWGVQTPSKIPKISVESSIA